MRKTASGRGRRTTITALTVVMVATMLPVIDTTTPVASAQTVGGSSCTSVPPTLVKNGSGFPAWSDGAGWTNPDQYETIATGDVDGDGKDELIGRNASSFETYRWDNGYAPGGVSGKAYNPTPGQWRQILPKSGAEVQSFATADGWWDPAVYSTVQLADVDPNNQGDELLVRLSDGLAVYRWNSATSTWGRPVETGAFSDADGWGQNGEAPTLAEAGGAEYYSTITTGNVDGIGAREVIARGKDGIEIWSFNGSSLTRIPTSTAILTDAEGWMAPEYYSTIRLADVDGNGRDELLARSSGGMLLYRYEPATSSWRQRETLTAWSDGAGWKGEAYYRTISVADVNGDGRADLVGRSRLGLDAQTFVDGPDDGSWAPLAPRSAFPDAEGWNVAENYATVQPADVDPAPGTEMIGRADGGVITYALRGEAWTPIGGVIGEFSNALGFSGSQNPPGGGLPDGFRYDTIRPVRAEPGQPEVVIGRGATGVITRRIDGSSPSAAFPAYTDLTTLASSADGTTDLGSTDDAQKRAFHHINSAAVRTYFGGQSGTTIIDQFRFPANSSKWAGLTGSLAGAQTTRVDDGSSVFDPGDEGLQAMNVPRATYNQVLQDTADWTSSVDEVSAHLLGTEGVKQFLTEGFLDQSNLVSSISANFEGNEALYAFFADLMWGLIGALAAVAAVFDPAADAAIIAAIVATASVAGAGTAGAMGFFNPNGFAASKAAELEGKLVDTLCTANRFIDESYDQIVQDYGLLKTAGATFNESKLTAEHYATARTAANRSQALWVWQQFGDAKPAVGVSNMWVGYCRPTDTTCKFNDSGTSDTISTDPASGVRYRLIGELPGSEGTDGNCEFDVLANTPDLKDLKPDWRAWASPRHTAGPLIGEPFVDESTGIQGWNLGNKWCGTL